MCTFKRIISLLVMVALLVMTGCSVDAPDTNDSETLEPTATLTSPSSPEGDSLLAGDVLPGALTALGGEVVTFNPMYIEIDRLDDGLSEDFGDANLFAFYGTDVELANCVIPFGGDPFDGSCDARLPETKLSFCTNPGQIDACRCTGNPSLDTDSCVDVVYSDWNNLLTDEFGAADPDKLAIHRLIDPVKLDASSFKTGSCVAPSNVLGKMDLTSAAVTNNTEYAYLALKRYDNNGDAGYAWLFNQVAPQNDLTMGECGGFGPLTYTITAEDVLIIGNFNPSAGAEILVRRATAEADGFKLIAQDVVDPDGLTDYGDPIWEEIPGITNLATVNTTFTDLGVFEVVNGVNEIAARTDKGALDGNAVGEHIFAESAIDFRVFTGPDSLCGRKFYGSVISQPSTAKTSDLKDLIGPQLFDFGSLSATGYLEPTCEFEFEYGLSDVTAPGLISPDPNNDPNLSCTWTFTNGATVKTSNDCAGTLVLDPDDPTGTWTGSVHVIYRTVLGCACDSDAGSVDAFKTLTATADMAPTCGLAFDYEGSVEGGSGEYDVLWTFSGTGTPTPLSSTALSGQVTTDANGDYMATMHVTDRRTDIVCEDEEAPIRAIDDPLGVELTLTPTCEREFSYEAIDSGGGGGATLGVLCTGPGSITDTAGTVVVGADGTYTCTARVEETRNAGTDAEVLCFAEDVENVDAFAPLTADVNLTETCSMSFEYAGSMGGGSGDLTPTWSFTPASSSHDVPTDSLNGLVNVDTTGLYEARLDVVDNRNDIECSTFADDDVNVYMPLAIPAAGLTPSCSLEFGYAATVTGGSPAMTANWAFTGPGGPYTVPDLVGTLIPSTPGTFTGTLSVEDVRSDVLVCRTSWSDSVAAWTPVNVEATMTPTCNSSFNYSALASGGSPAGVSYSWTFSDPGNVTPTSTNTASGSAGVSVVATPYTAYVQVVDLRTDLPGICLDNANASGTPYAPIVVTIAPNSTRNECSPDLATDALDYTATVSGGDGAYTYTWSGCSSSSAICTVDPSDSDFCADASVFVTVDDGAAICPADDSETEVYTKVTIIESTDN